MESTRVALYALPAGIKEEIRSYSCGISKSTDVPSEVDSETGVIRIHKENSSLHFACSLCHRVFKTLEEQKLHYKSEEHLNEVKKAIFQDEESSDSEDEDALEVVEDGCLLTVCLPSANVTIYKRLLESGLSNREVSASQFASHLNGHFCVILYRSGYFILGIFDKGTLLVSRQEKRYTTRRKQGGAQHKKDNSTGKAISMGARLRRHNEELMQEFV